MTAAKTLADRRALSRVSPLAYAPPMDPAPDDSALMLRYRDGDVEAFEALYRRHNDALYRYLLRQCRHRDTADDVFQDVWGKLIKARRRYRPTAKFTTFLYHIARNCVIDHARRNRRHQHNAGIDPDTQPAGGTDHDDETERSLARRRLESALLLLPDEQREVFLLFEEAEMSLGEIANVTGAKRETVKSRLRYAVSKLKAAIKEQIADSLEAT